MQTCESCGQSVPTQERRVDVRARERAARAARAAEAGLRRITSGREQAIPHAKAKLRKLSAQHAAEFVATLPHREKYVYAQAESEDQARTTVLRKLAGYLPNE